MCITGVIRIVYGLEVSNERYKKIIIGPKGNNINEVKTEAQKAISELLRAPVDLHLNVSVKISPKKESDKKSSQATTTKTENVSSLNTTIDLLG